MTRILIDFGASIETLSWSLERYHTAIATGLLTEYDAIELIHGKLINKAPKRDDHSCTVENLHLYFRKRIGSNYRYRSENPLSLPPNSEPEPDFVVAEKPNVGRPTTHPKAEEVRLVIEVAYNTLEFDRNVKGPLYAGAGILEYWIINLKARKVEVHLLPATEDRTWKRVLKFSAGEYFDSPFAGTVQVNDLLPNDQV